MGVGISTGIRGLANVEDQLRATTENGAKAHVQANVSESNEGQFGLLSLQLTVGD